MIVEKNSKKYVISKIFVAISYFLLGLGILMVGFSVVLTVSFQIHTMNVVSNSMSPTFDKGDLVLVSKNYNNLEVGDIIVYEPEWYNNKKITHRIVEITDDRIVTRGDNNNSNDPSLSKDDVFGEVIGIGKYYGWIFNYYFTIIIFVVAIIIGYIGERIYKHPVVAPRRAVED